MEVRFMKFRVLFLKKKNIYYTILAIIILVLLAILLISKKTATTFNTITNNKAIKADLTGDGAEDILYINTNKDKYYIQVNTKDNSLYLKPDMKMNTVGTYYSYWPMKVTLMDINRNKVPEIFVQASEKGVPVQHIFIWDKNDFKDIFCSSNNIIGFIDCKNNKTPKIISGNISNGTMTQVNYVLINNELYNFNLTAKDNFLGKNTILSFIKYVQGLPGSEPYKPSDIFYPGLTGKDLNPISKMTGGNITYGFEDGLFMDTKWNKDGEVSEVKWILNFKGTSNTDTSIIKPYKITLSLKATSNTDTNLNYKIQTVTVE
jgi:hypothetical protein